MGVQSTIAGLAGALIAAGSAWASGFDAESFKVWTDARVGTGEPVYWYSTGTVYAYPSGEVLFRMDGFDTARAHQPDPDQPLVHQYNRKIYFFRDADTGAFLDSYDDQPVEPIAYPYQFITYELKDDTVETFVEQGVEPRVARIGPGSSMTARTVGDTHVFSAPVFIDFPIPGSEARYQAWENYDFFINPDASVEEPHQLSWARYGPLPQWAGGGASIMHLVTWRVERFEDLPEDIQAKIDADHPLWREPPADLDDIRALQAAPAE